MAWEITIFVYNEMPTENEKLLIGTALVELSGMDIFIIAPNDVDVKSYRKNYKCKMLTMEVKR